MTASQISILMIFPESDRKDTEKKMQKERQVTCCQEATGSELSFLFFWLETFTEFQKEPERQDIPIHKPVPAGSSGPVEQVETRPPPVVAASHSHCSANGPATRCCSRFPLRCAKPCQTLDPPHQLTLPLSFPLVSACAAASSWNTFCCYKQW